jgi:hypothetical protein
MKTLLTSTVHRVVLGALALTASAVCLASSASAQSCFELWRNRNQFYADAGYCFKTEPAIRYFGNRGCIYENEADVPLSSSVRVRVEAIKRLERRLGC